jgi:hypothetical protein
VHPAHHAGYYPGAEGMTLRHASATRPASSDS